MGLCRSEAGHSQGTAASRKLQARQQEQQQAFASWVDHPRASHAVQAGKLPCALSFAASETKRTACNAGEVLSTQLKSCSCCEVECSDYLIVHRHMYCTQSQCACSSGAVVKSLLVTCILLQMQVDDTMATGDDSEAQAAPATII